MKFSYKKIASGIIRPIIPIEVFHKDTAVPYEVLVDSGADFCVFIVKFDYAKEEIEIRPRQR